MHATPERHKGVHTFVFTFYVRSRLYTAMYQIVSTQRLKRDTNSPNCPDTGAEQVPSSMPQDGHP